jgi:hypothetical protein
MLQGLIASAARRLRKPYLQLVQRRDALHRLDEQLPDEVLGDGLVSHLVAPGAGEAGSRGCVSWLCQLADGHSSSLPGGWVAVSCGLSL